MPPVDGRELSFVSFKPPSLYNLAVATSPSTVSVSVLPSVLIEYPFGAFVSFPYCLCRKKKWQYEWDGAEQCHFLGGF